MDRGLDDCRGVGKGGGLSGSHGGGERVEFKLLLNFRLHRLTCTACDAVCRQAEEFGEACVGAL